MAMIPMVNIPRRSWVMFVCSPQFKTLSPTSDCNCSIVIFKSLPLLVYWNLLSLILPYFHIMVNTNILGWLPQSIYRRGEMGLAIPVSAFLITDNTPYCISPQIHNFQGLPHFFSRSIIFLFRSTCQLTWKWSVSWNFSQYVLIDIHI